MKKPEPRLGSGCAPLASVPLTRIWTIAGRELSANCAKARLSRSSSVSPAVGWASRQLISDDLSIVSAAFRNAGKPARETNNKISANFTIEPRKRKKMNVLYRNCSMRTSERAGNPPQVLEYDRVN